MKKQESNLYYKMIDDKNPAARKFWRIRYFQKKKEIQEYEEEHRELAKLKKKKDQRKYYAELEARNAKQKSEPTEYNMQE